MSTFCAVNDELLSGAIRRASRRVVFVAPGVHKVVAEALGERFKEIGGRLDVTVVLDPDEEVCRAGYGDQEALALLHKLANSHHFALRSQSGLRIGVLMVDEKLIVWSPTPRSIEAPPGASTTPNGVALGGDPVQQLEQVVAPEGIDADPNRAEIGRAAVTAAQVGDTLDALKKNPPIPVDLARVTRVFSSKLQFVELEVKGGRLSRTQLRISPKLLNADVRGELADLIDSRLRAFDELRDHEVEVPAFTRTGELSYDADRKPGAERISEAGLLRVRNDIEREYLYTIPGHGHLMEKARKAEFEKRLAGYRKQLEAHAKGLRGLIEAQAHQIVDEAVNLIVERSRRGSEGKPVDVKAIRKALEDGLKKTTAGKPEVTWRYKDVTYEHTTSKSFHEMVKKTVPPYVMKRLGEGWTAQFDAAAEARPRNRKK